MYEKYLAVIPGVIACALITLTVWAMQAMFVDMRDSSRLNDEARAAQAIWFVKTEDEIDVYSVANLMRQGRWEEYKETWERMDRERAQQ